MSILRVAVIAAFALLAACPPNNVPQPMPPAPSEPAGGGYVPPGDGTSPPSTADAGAPAQNVPDAAAAATRGADGASCLTAADCQSGICEGEGCGADQPGTCKPKARACTRDLRAYCGCDGVTFRTSGSCAGRRYASRGECPP